MENYRINNNCKLLLKVWVFNKIKTIFQSFSKQLTSLVLISFRDLISMEHVLKQGFKNNNQEFSEFHRSKMIFNFRKMT
jgi:hypothetical protein